MARGRPPRRRAGEPPGEPQQPDLFGELFGEREPSSVPSIGGAGGGKAQDLLPDVRDGLNRLDRVILVELARAQEELGGRNVPTALLYGRVVEHASAPRVARAL